MAFGTDENVLFIMVSLNNVTIICIYMYIISGDSSLLITVAAENEFPPGGVGTALTDQITATAQAAGIVVTVQVTRFGKYKSLT